MSTRARRIPDATDHRHWEAATVDPGDPLEFLLGFIDSLDPHLAVLDARGTILAVNASWRAFGEENGLEDPRFGIGTNYLDAAKTTEEASDIHAGLQAVLDGEEDAVEFTYPCHGPTEERWFTFKARRFQHGGETYVSVAHENITQRTLAERAREARRQELEESNALLDRFASVVSHDLREPLRSVDGFLKVLQRRYGDDLDPEAHDLLDEARGSAQRMADLVRGVRQLTRVDADELAREPVDLETVMEAVRADLDAAIEDADARIAWEDLPTVDGDPALLKQLMQNLVSNALRYRHEDRAPRIRVDARMVEGAWDIQVTDNGLGIPEEEQEAIFEMFQRGSQGPDKGGTGLGLPICRRIAERHGGELWVESTPGEGSTFHLGLPGT